MPLARLHAPFDHPNWIYELKWDGFRALAYVNDGRAQLVSRKRNAYNCFGRSLYRVACENDLEGIVAKLKAGFYTPEEATWVKIKNPAYSQMEGRRELFERRRAPASNDGDLTQDHQR